MKQSNDLNLFNQLSRIVLTMILRQMDLTEDQISTIRIDKVRRLLDGIKNVAASAGIVGEPVANLYHWRADHEVPSCHSKTVRANT